MIELLNSSIIYVFASAILLTCLTKVLDGSVGEASMVSVIFGIQFLDEVSCVVWIACGAVTLPYKKEQRAWFSNST